MAVDFARRDAAAAEQERARRQRIDRFIGAYLTLGGDITQWTNSTNHQGEMAEALGLAASRWQKLLDAEAQVQREQQAIAARPPKRPREPSDDYIAPEVVKRMDDAFAAQTDSRRVSLDELKAFVKTERQLLESYIVKRKGS